MDNASRRGCMYLVGLLIFAFFACFLFPFVILPSVGTAVTLPVITVPGEYYRQDWPSADFEIVNTLGGALLANILMLFIVFRARAVSKNWTKEVPGRFQGFVELIAEIWWSLTKQQAGSKPKVKNWLFPLVASIFLFLFVANWGKLLPGVESVGVLHCAAYDPVSFNGFPVQETEFAGRPYFVLESNQPLNTGTPGTSQSYRQCEAGLGEHHYIEDGYLVTELDPFYDEAVVHTVEAGDTLASIAAQYQSEVEDIVAGDLPESEGRAELQDHLANGEYNAIKITYDDPYAQYNSWRETTITTQSIVAANEAAGRTIAFADEAGDDHAAADDHGEEDADAASEGAADESTEEVSLVERPLQAGQELLVREELIGEAATTRSNQLYTVAPFVRGVSTDLSFTLGLAIMAFFAIQIFGISELGLNYFQKFINVHAIGNVAKRPLGAVDFVVGLFEIISEIGKVISLSFRLFGALFAGSVLYAVFLFLTGTTIPIIILLLELIVGLAQAGVFAVLTLLFCAQAMVSHIHDDEHGEAHH